MRNVGDKKQLFIDGRFVESSENVELHINPAQKIGTDFEGNLVGLGDAGAQAEQAMKNVSQLLEECGSELAHIVKTTTYITDPRYREPVYQEVGKWLRGVFPISTGIVVAGLGQPEWLMEIDVIAVIPED